jgi:glycosyltransferase involved in cell wall biosynthesis
MRFGIDVHVLNGPAQGTASVWQNLLSSFPPDNEYVLYSFDPEHTRKLFPQEHFLHRRIPIRQSHLRIQVAYPFLAWRDRCAAFHANYYGPVIGMHGLVLTVHDVLYLDFPAFAAVPRRWQFQLLARAAVRAAEQVITDSHYSKDRIVRHFHVPSEKITVVYPGLEASWFEPDPSALGAAWARIRDSLPPRYTLTVGRWDPRKNFPMAARVVRRLRQMGLTDGLVIVGPDDFGTDTILRQLRQEGLEEHIVRLEDLSTEELRAVYSHAQCLLYLSLAEGFGLPLVEAMAMGLPVVASDRTAVPEICHNAALTVDPTDEAAAYNAAKGVLETPALRSELIGRGHSRSRAFLASEMAAKTLAVYHRAASWPLADNRSALRQ